MSDSTEKAVDLINEPDYGIITLAIKYKDMPRVMDHLKRIGIKIRLPEDMKALVDFYTDYEDGASN